MAEHFGELDETEEDDIAGGASCFGDRTCTAAGWRIFLRTLQCPCARPRMARKIKNAAELGSVTLRVPVPQQKRHARPDNVVVTSKYTPWDFFPRAMTLQFRRAVNLFYLCQVFLLIVGYYFPNVFQSPFTPFGTMLVLAFVLGVTLITEFKDDQGRHRSDAKTNGHPITTIHPTSGKKVKKHWGDLVPGDLILLRNRELVPADVILIQSSQPTGVVYIETSGIDGETNLKIRRVSPEMKKMVDSQNGLAHKALDGVITCEEPNPFLSFSGSFQPSHSPTPVPLGFENMILRGSEVRNTNWAVAMVCYAGHETKLVLSKRATPSKFSTMDYVINRIVYIALLQLIVMTVFCDIVLFTAVPNTKNISYFKFVDTTQIFELPGFIAFFLTFYVIFGNMVPIDLYVVFEIATGVQSWLLVNDLEMYDPVTDTPAGSKSTNLISEIGQVSHVFSDKTGTLTQNVMRLVGCSLDGRRFGVKVPDAVTFSSNGNGGLGRADNEETMLGKRNVHAREIFADLLREINNPKVADFLLLLSVCHTVVMDVDEEGKPRYNAEGPDEEALVKAAAALGFVLKNTDDNVYEVVDETRNVSRKFQILGINGFNSDRKRMSIIAQDLASGEYMLLLKGADSIVAELSVEGKAPTKLQSDLDSFAQAGLRTLLVARRRLSQEEAQSFVKQHSDAKHLIGKAKTDAMDAIAAKYEQKLEIIGATAIEDALQEGVPETIKLLRDADIKVWVLTGDKVDTAVNIGFSSKLLDPEMHQILIDGNDTNELVKQLDEYYNVLHNLALSQGLKNDTQDWESKSLALIVTGKAVECLLAKQKGTVDSQSKFIGVANACSVVLACRVSPAQKALIVRAATQSARKRGARPVVSLAIGDGANDVAMIQEAKVGVGISGKEGLQAVNSSDFSIAQFRFLGRLMFVHGRWSYRRNAQLVMFVCYSWQVLNWPIFFYMFYCLFSGEQVYFQTFYVTLFAWLNHYIPIGQAWFDRDLSAETVFKYPKSYDLGRLNQLLSMKQVGFALFLRSLCHALIVFFFLIGVFPQTLDISTLGATVYMGVVVCVQLRIYMTLITWNWVIVLAIFLWFIFYAVGVSVIDEVFGDGPLLDTSMVPSAYENVFLLIGILIIFEYVVYGFRRVFYPSPTEVLMEYDRGYGDHSTRPKFHGLDVMGEVVGEGVDRTIYIPAKAVGDAFRGYRKKKRIHDELNIVVAEEMDEKGPGAKFGTKRSSFAYDSPAEGH
jgi:phospholipid-transporting ATPase